jgi:hypothetical protein
MTFELWGALLFGVVVGWICYRTLRRSTDAAKLSDLATVVGVIGGGVVTALFKSGDLFASYSIGLAIGFFLYLIISFIVDGRQKTGGWMFDQK